MGPDPPSRAGTTTKRHEGAANAANGRPGGRRYPLRAPTGMGARRHGESLMASEPTPELVKLNRRAWSLWIFAFGVRIDSRM